MRWPRNLCPTADEHLAEVEYIESNCNELENNYDLAIIRQILSNFKQAWTVLNLVVKN